MYNVHCISSLNDIHIYLITMKNDIHESSVVTSLLHNSKFLIALSLYSNHDGTILHYAAYHNNVNIVRTILNHTVQIDVENKVSVIKTTTMLRTIPCTMCYFWEACHTFLRLFWTIWLYMCRHNMSTFIICCIVVCNF